MGSVVGVDGLVEREAELTRLDALCGEAVAGRGTTAVVQGPAGVGKTALLSDAVAGAERVGMRALTASGVELEAAAEKLTRRQPTQGLGAKLRVGIPGLSVELAGDLKQSALDREELVNATGVVQGLDRLVSVFTARGREPVLICEDTDAWLSRTDGGQTADAANRLFADSLGVLVRDVDIRILIATHTGYVKLDGYRAIRERLLTEVEIPSLEKPKDAIATILQKRIDVTAIGGVVADVFTDEALGKCVRLRSLDRGSDDLDPLAAEDLLEGAGELRVAIVD
jgi:hypothetical protein